MIGRSQASLWLYFVTALMEYVCWEELSCYRSVRCSAAALLADHWHVVYICCKTADARHARNVGLGQVLAAVVCFESLAQGACTISLSCGCNTRQHKHIACRIALYLYLLCIEGKLLF
jgi:hypothetical protein